MIRVLVILGMFFLFFSLLIISNNNLAMNKTENVKKFSELFVVWLDKVYANAQSITGNVVKMDWSPQ